MKRLLIVEDSRLFVTALEREVARNNLFSVQVAHSMQEARALLKSERFFAAISDLELPDSRSGEVVSMLLEHQLPVVVLSSHGAGPAMEFVHSLPVVDYVIKTSQSDVAYAVRLAELLLVTQGLKTFLVGFDDELLAQSELLFKPLGLEVTHHADPLQVETELARNAAGLLLIDYDTTQEGGVALAGAIRRQHSPQEVPILFVTSRRDPALEARLLKAGASDFLIKPFSREEFAARTFTLVGNSERFKQIETYAKTVDRYVITSSTDEKGIIRTVSQAFCDISGYTKEELIGRNHNIVRHPDMPASLYQQMWQTLKAGQSWEGEIKNRKKDGGFYWVQVHIDPLFDRRGEITGYVAIRQDVTDKKQIEQLSITDPMTGLYNRRHFVASYSALLADAGKRVCALLLFDVDKFKQYNDHYGHQAGDRVLIEIGKLMQAWSQGHNLPFRLGGEEFGFLGLFDDRAAAESFAERFRQAVMDLEIAHTHNSAAEVVTASFGLAFVQPEHTLDDLYREADEALYSAKEGGRNRVVVSPKSCESGL